MPETEAGHSLLKWMFGGTTLGGLLGIGIGVGTVNSRLSEHDRKFKEHEKVDDDMHETMTAALTGINEKLISIAEDVAFLKGRGGGPPGAG